MLITALAIGVVVMLTPADGAAGDIASSFARVVGHLASPSQKGQDFAGTPAVGALFTTDQGKLGQHFCTASVVSSPHGDLVVTAAHCVSGGVAGVAFVPGYRGGAAPYGIWTVTKIYADKAWTASGNPDDDVAFLEVAIGALAAQPGCSSVIAGAMTPEQVKANAASAEWIPSAGQLAEIDQIVPPSAPERY